MGDPGVGAFSEGAVEPVPEALALGSRDPTSLPLPEGTQHRPISHRRVTLDKKPSPQAGRT